MPSAAARRLTLAHKKAQGQIGTQTVARMRTIWGRLDGDNLDGTFQRWLTAAIPVVKTQRLVSAQTAGAYLTAFRALEVTGDFAPVLATELAEEALTTSLLVTGPISVKKAMARGIPLVRALTVAEAASSASAMRYAMEGGRDTILATTQADDQARGWERVASGNACPFCQMLAGRGAVYGETSADFESHDGCGCTAEPVYR